MTEQTIDLTAFELAQNNQDIPGMAAAIEHCHQTPAQRSGNGEESFKDYFRMIADTKRTIKEAYDQRNANRSAVEICYGGCSGKS